MDPIRAEAVRTMYGQIRMTSFATVVIVIYMVGVSLPFTPWQVVLGWMIAPAAQWIVRELGFRQFRAARPADAQMQHWANRFVWQQALVGATWAATVMLFAHPEQPLSVALTLSCLYSIGAGSVVSLSYHPRANVVLCSIIYGTVLVRMLAVGGLGYTLLGTASALYGVTMIGYCRNQSRAVHEGLRIRFENIELVEALKREKAEAEGARRRAETASLAKSQFLAAASHDLRQPLYALSLFSASLKSLELDGEGRAIVDRIGDSITAMEQLFAGLLDISRLEAGTVEPRLAAVAVDALFDRLSQVYRPIAREQRLDLRFRSDGEWIASDAVLIEQVLSNLVSNALRATSRGGVLVAARRRGAAVRLEVWDTGIGIGIDDRTRIFDEFVQLGNPERDRRKGLGLGLSIARRAAALLGATIEVRSRAGKGSCFALALPAGARPRSVAIQPPAVAGFALSRDHALPVLIVEDDADVRAGLQQLLTRWGVAHDAVINADDALRAIGEKHYGLVLSDQRLGGTMDGLSLLREIGRRCTTPAVPAMALVTGELDPQFASAAAKDEVPVLTKPVRAEQLRGLLGLEAADPFNGPLPRGKRSFSPAGGP